MWTGKHQAYAEPGIVGWEEPPGQARQMRVLCFHPPRPALAVPVIHEARIRPGEPLHDLGRPSELHPEGQQSLPVVTETWESNIMLVLIPGPWLPVDIIGTPAVHPSRQLRLELISEWSAGIESGHPKQFSCGFRCTRCHCSESFSGVAEH